MPKFSFASVNMRRRNTFMHVLLNDNSADDILFVQEPWYGQIGMKRSDADSQGKEVWGGTANPKWTLHSLLCSPTIRVKVMTFFFFLNPLSCT